MNRDSQTTSNSQWKMVIWLLRLSCFLVFTGRGWQHLFTGDAPYRTLFWNEELLTPLVNSLFGMSWNEWATSEKVDGTIQTSIYLTGAFYFLCAVLSLLVKRTHTISKVLLAIGCASLTFLAYLYYMDRFFQFAQFLEYAAQFMAPLLLIWAVSAEKNPPPIGFDLALRLSVAVTFISHGLYAFGYYPVPGNFVDMIIQILHVSDQQAISLLEIAAILDFAVGGVLILGVLKPFAFGYAVFWGLATTFARLAANLSWGLLGDDLLRWLPEFLQRGPHAIVPAAGLVLTSAYVAKKAASLLERKQLSKQST
jgi:hypothetical protein